MPGVAFTTTSNGILPGWSSVRDGWTGSAGAGLTRGTSTFVMLLKGTYEERIFHAVMQRDQWFQVLIGSKRKELGQPDDDELASKAEDVDDGPVDVPDETGRLTPEEKASVMMDLRPTPV